MEQDICIWSSMVYSSTRNIYTISWRLFVSLSCYAWAGIHFWKQQRWMTQSSAPGYLRSACFEVCVKLCEQWWKKLLCHPSLLYSASCRKWKTRGEILFVACQYLCFSDCKGVKDLFHSFPLLYLETKGKRRTWYNPLSERSKNLVLLLPSR